MKIGEKNFWLIKAKMKMKVKNYEKNDFNFWILHIKIRWYGNFHENRRKEFFFEIFTCEGHTRTEVSKGLIDLALKPFLPHVNWHSQDNLDLLSKSARQNYEDTVLVALDVVNLYKNISHTFWVEVLDYWLENYPERLHARVCFRMRKIHFTKQKYKIQ